tara:strand:+ start:798 stop:911 length:114 start_codon:yes stop_codon:yes gene_type:complete
MHERLSGQNTGRGILAQGGMGRAVGMCRYFIQVLAGL